MEKADVNYVVKCITEDIHKFYVWGKWERLRADVLKSDKGECQMCKEKGTYQKATTVHHVNYVKKHPDLALEMWYTWNGIKKRNLISLCHDCHEKIHAYRKKNNVKPLTEERWE